MRSRFPRPHAFLAFLALAIASPAFAQSTNTAATNRHCLWRVEGKSNVVYLLGSFHLLKEADYPLALPLETAYSNSAIVVFETDIGKMKEQETQMKILAKARLPEGQTLKEQLSAGTYAAFEKKVKDAGLPVQTFDSFKPSMAAFTLAVLELQKLGLDPDQGVDKHFYELAVRDHRQIVPLETVDFQLDLITEFSKEEGEMLMKSTLKDIDNTSKMFGEIVAAWRAGDAAQLEKQLNESMREVPVIFKRLVTDRSKRWVSKVEELLGGNKNAIVIVGAGHLVGPEGLVELLKAKGLKVIQQ